MISGEVDFAQLEELADNLEKIDMDAMCRHIAKKTADKLLRTVKSATPRGETQTLALNWNVSANKNPIVTKKSNEYEVVLKNNTYYADYVEHGHRQVYVTKEEKRIIKGWVKGKYFVLKSEIRVRRDLPKLVKAEMKRWIKKELKL